MSETSRTEKTRVRRAADLTAPLDGQSVADLGDLLGRLAKRKNRCEKDVAAAVRVEMAAAKEHDAAAKLSVQVGDRMKAVLDTLAGVLPVGGNDEA